MKKITRAGEKPPPHLVPARHGELHLAARDLATIPRSPGNCWPRPVIPAARVSRDLNICSTRRPAAADKIHEDIAVELQQMWHDNLGIQMDLRQVEWKVLLSSYSHLDYQWRAPVGLAITTTRTRFSTCFISNDGNNQTGWKNARYDALINEANEQTDIQQREATFPAGGNPPGAR